MTKISKPVARETIGGVFSKGKVRPVIVSIEPPNVLGFRLKGDKLKVYLTAEGCFIEALRIQLAADKRNKKDQRGMKPRRRTS